MKKKIEKSESKKLSKKLLKLKNDNMDIFSFFDLKLKKSDIDSKSTISSETAETSSILTFENFANKNNLIKKQITLDYFGINIPKANDENKFPILKNNIKLKIIHWNINGIKSIINKGYLQEMVNKEKPDIFCLNETKITQENLIKEKYDFLFNKDYLSYWNFSIIKKGYSGVAIFTKYQPIKIIDKTDIKEIDLEGRVIYLEYSDFIILSVYVPNGGSRFKYRVTKWDPIFRNFICDLKIKYKKDIIICGDFNVCNKEIDLFSAELYEGNPTFTEEERVNFKQLLGDADLIDIYRHMHPLTQGFSWFGNKWDKLGNKGRRIDYFLVSKNMINNIKKTGILKKYDGSDHVPIYIEYFNENSI